MTMRVWTGTEPLDNGRAYLLEASAGTGKTWQIEALVVRLIAEHSLPIARILVITFTDAATAELRDRIRHRLVQARDALASEEQAPSDPVIAQLWQDAALRRERHLRLAQALCAFDLAPISTIHGFSKRMLEQLAFESGQEPGLTLLTDAGPLLDALVADELARIYDRADAHDLELLSDMDWDGPTLRALAADMSKAVAPAVLPSTGDVAPDADALTFVGRWREQVAALRAWLDGEQGQAGIADLRALVAPSSPRRLYGGQLKPRDVSASLDSLREWLTDGALRSKRMKTEAKVPWWEKLQLDTFCQHWLGTDAELAACSATALLRRVSDLIATQEQLWPLPRASFATQIRARVHAELARGALLTHDTVLSHLAERIAEQGSEGALATSIRSRFDAALVDEFQDTDGAQWPVLRAVFLHPERRLLIIGDPKQAIYGFRGADVHVYLDARRVAHTHATMTENRRSDAAYVDAMNHVFGANSAVFEIDGVDYVQVAAHHTRARVRGLPSVDGRPRRAFELRWFDGDTLELAHPDDTGAAVLNMAQASDLAPRLCAIEAARLLGASVEVCDRHDQGQEPAWRRLTPGDIAVLVRTNHQAERMRRELSALRIPAVSAARGSVLDSPVAAWLCTFLDALAEPSRDQPARALAVTPLFGWTAAELVQALDAHEAIETNERKAASLDQAPASWPRSWDDWIATLTQWSRSYAKQGFIRALESALDAHDVLPRLLALEDGERHATDLRHLAELCHAEERRTRLGPAALASWLRVGATSGSDDEQDATERALRIESDARAVQIVTVHKSKGLEYPIVLMPFAWTAKEQKDDGAGIRFHARSDDGSWRAMLDLSAQPSTSRQAALAGQFEEARQEELRILYVALTRARHHCVAWLGAVARRSKGGRRGTPVRSALLGVVSRPREHDGRLVAAPVDDTRALTRMARLADSSRATVGVGEERLARSALAPLQLAAETTEALRARPWRSSVSLSSPFRIASYSSLVGGRAQLLDEPRRPQEQLMEQHDDGTHAPALANGDDDAAAGVTLGEPEGELAARSELGAPVHLSALFGGTEVGTWVHSVLEQLDFASGRAKDERDAAALVQSLGERHGIRAAQQHALLVAALPRILDTPLDGAHTGLPSGYCLRRLPRRDRLDELDFDFRVGAGNAFRPGTDGRCAVIHEHAAWLALQARLDDEPSWPGAAWLHLLLERARGGTPVLPAIAGILTGSIDLVLRVGESPASARYFVADYKTNRITSRAASRDTLQRHYTQPWLHWAMAHHGYPLQALLYTVALHRLLRQRLGPTYDYERHIGGYMYLFVRGMQGDVSPRDGGLSLGVLHDRWPRHVVVGFDAALSGSGPDEVCRAMDDARGRKGPR